MGSEDEYLTFEQAAELLSVSRSTLYRWLRDGEVPGHKLGRQWRFVREELEQWSRRGPSASPGVLDEVSAVLAGRWEEKMKGVDEMKRQQMIEAIEGMDVAGRMIWGAADEGASVIHVQPAGGRHEVRYRTGAGLERLVALDPEQFAALDARWRGMSVARRSEDSRRALLERDAAGAPEGGAGERVQVRYQKLETMAGERVSLRIVRGAPEVPPLERLTADGPARATLKRWAGASHGLVVLSGRSGSGKTSTAYACLDELTRAGDRVIFTIEGEVGALIEGVNQVEIDLDDARAYRDTFTSIFDSDPDVLFIASTFAQRHRPLLWGTALNAAEQGHLVFVQMEAESAKDALERLQREVDRPVDDHLVGVCWQELVPRENGRGRQANYDLLSGPLDIDEV
jgi:excisionase family DNA binding protein